MAAKRQASPEPDEPKRRRVASPSPTSSSSAVPQDAPTPQQLHFHAILQQDALESMLMLRDDLLELEDEVEQLGEQVESLEVAHREQVKVMRVTLDAMTEALRQSASMTATTTNLTQDATAIGRDAGTLSLRFTDYVSKTVLPFYHTEPGVDHLVLLLPTEIYDVLPRTTSDILSSPMLSGLFPTVAVTAEKLETADADFAMLCAHDGSDATVVLLVDSWRDILEYLDPAVNTRWPDGPLPAEHATRPQADLDKAVFEAPEDVILHVQTKFVAENWDEHSVEPGDRIYAESPMIDNWVLGYKLGEPGEPCLPKWLPKHHLDPSASSSRALEPHPPRAHSNDYLDHLDSLDRYPPDLVEATRDLAALRQSLCRIVRAVAVEQIGRMLRMTVSLTNLSNQATRLRTEADENSEREKELHEELCGKRERWFRLRGRVLATREDFLEQLAMLVVLSKGP
ncbi:hypothetical protein JCM6882_002068 [Rhodosporidiobolus microsporus]